MSRLTVSVEEYAAEVLDLVAPLDESANVALREAPGRTLARPVYATLDIPPFANSAMDGFAVRCGQSPQGTVLRVVADVLAGSSADPRFGDGECVRIMTGAPLPTNADAVIPVEDTTLLAPSTIRIERSVTVGRHVRGAGEDVRTGDEVLPSGTRLTSRGLAAAAACGVAVVECVRQPVVGIVATGDELVAPGAPLVRGQIYESNAHFLAAAVERDGGLAEVASGVPDEASRFAATLDELSARCDLIVVSGGVSVGDADVTRIVLEAAGANLRHVAMQPGKPQAWGRWGAVPVIALPGNPVSAEVSYELFVSPVVDRFHCRPTPSWKAARTLVAWSSPPGKRQIVPVIVDVDENGRQVVRPAHHRGSASHVVTSLAAANALAAVAEDVTDVAVGDAVSVRRLR